MSEKGVFVGYAVNMKAWKIYFPQRNKVLYRRNVRVAEELIPRPMDVEVSPKNSLWQPPPHRFWDVVATARDHPRSHTKGESKAAHDDSGSFVHAQSLCCDEAKAGGRHVDESKPFPAHSSSTSHNHINNTADNFYCLDNEGKGTVRPKQTSSDQEEADANPIDLLLTDQNESNQSTRRSTRSTKPAPNYKEAESTEEESGKNRKKERSPFPQKT